MNFGQSYRHRIALSFSVIVLLLAHLPRTDGLTMRHTEAFRGCFKSRVAGRFGGFQDDILTGQSKTVDDGRMGVKMCLDFCRSHSYNLGGVTGGNECMCGFDRVDGKKLLDEANALNRSECLKKPCTGNATFACGSDTAVAIYDAKIGSCGGLMSNQDSGTIYSPRWPGKFGNASRCRWTVYVPSKYRADPEMMAGHELAIHFTHFKLGNGEIKIYIYRNATDVDPTLIDTYSGDIKPHNILIRLSDVYAIYITYSKGDAKGAFVVQYEIFKVDPVFEMSVPDLDFTYFSDSTMTNPVLEETTRESTQSNTTTVEMVTNKSAMTAIQSETGMPANNATMGRQVSTAESVSTRGLVTQRPDDVATSGAREGDTTRSSIFVIGVFASRLLVSHLLYFSE